jgi:hypothetical protein
VCLVHPWPNCTQLELPHTLHPGNAVHPRSPPKHAYTTLQSPAAQAEQTGPQGTAHPVDAEHVHGRPAVPVAVSPSQHQ